MRVADVLDHGQVVRDEQISEAELALQVDHQVEHLGLDRDVERGDRLVGDDQLGLQRERAGDADALALAARELVRIIAHLRPAQSDALEQRGHARGPVAAAGDAVHAQRLADDVARRHARIERGERVLEDDLHPPPVGAQLDLAEPRDVLAVERDAAGGRLDQPQHGAAHRRLAAARFADQAERLARRDREAHAVDREDVAGGAPKQSLLDGKVLLEVLHLQHRRNGRGAGRG